MAKKKTKKVVNKNKETKMKTESKAAIKSDKKTKSENEKAPRNVRKILACILQFTLIFVVLAVAALMIYACSTHDCLHNDNLKNKSFRKYLFFWIMIIATPILGAILSIIYGWFGITQKNRTYRSFMVVGAITSFFLLVTTCAVISFVCIPELQPPFDITIKTELAVGIMIGVIITSLVFAASQRSFAMKRTFGFLIAAIVLSLSLAIYNTVVVVFPYNASDLYIACYLGFVWIRTLVVAAFTGVYVVRMFKMCQIKKEMAGKLK